MAQGAKPAFRKRMSVVLVWLMIVIQMILNMAQDEYNGMIKFHFSQVHVSGEKGNADVKSPLVGVSSGGKINDFNVDFKIWHFGLGRNHPSGRCRTRAI